MQREESIAQAVGQPMKGLTFILHTGTTKAFCFCSFYLVSIEC